MSKIKNVLIREEIGSTKVGPSGLVSQSDVKSVAKLFNKANHQIAALSQREVETKEELKNLNAQIKEITAKLTERKKSLRDESKLIDKKKLFLLGELSAYQNQLKEMGESVKFVDVKKLLKE